MQLTDAITPIKTGDDTSEEERVARLASLPITSPDGSLCMSFWYHMAGERAGVLRISYREEGNEQVLWSMSGNEGSRWREGRVLLPPSRIPYQVRN